MPPIEDLAPLDLAREIDTLCDRFEAQWRSGARPRVEDFLAPLAAEQRTPLLRALLLVEIELRGAAGEPVLATEYAARFPEHGAVLAEILAAQARPASVGRFEVRAVLGEGAFGVVYRAYDPQLDREVALKVPKLDVLGAHFDAARFLREAKAAAALRHPNVCPVYEAGVEGGRPYIVMAFVAGQTLAAVLQGRPVPAPQAAALVRCLALALQAAHDKGVVHRDLKPSNVMMDRERQDVVITDFGLARVAGPCEAERTQSGLILGTPAYMAPEQARGDHKEVGPRSDLYSLGVILYELLTGRPPFAGTAGAVIGQVLHVEPTPPSRVEAGIDARLEAICARAMAKDPDRRHASMRALAEELDGYLHAVGVAQTEAGPYQQLMTACTAAPPSRRRWYLAGGILVLVLIGVLALVYPPGNADAPPAAAPAATGTLHEGWTPLFNGRDLTGWRATLGKLEQWQADDGELIGDAAGGQVSLVNDCALRDFEIRLEYRFADVGANGGLILHAPSGATLEIDLIEESGVSQEQRARQPTTGNLFWLPAGRKRVERLAPVVPLGQWNRLEVRLVHAALEVIVNGALVLRAGPDELPPLREELLSTAPVGLTVGLQSHGKQVHYRQVEFRGLETNPPAPWPLAPDVPAPLTHYTFDEPRGLPFRDARRRSAAAVPNTSIRTAAGVSGRAAEFVGLRDGYVKVPSHPTMHGWTEFTAACWVNGSSGHLLGRWAGSAVAYRLSADGQTVTATFGLPRRKPAVLFGPLAAGHWTHVAAVYDGRAARLFVNGYPVMDAPVAPVDGPPLPLAGLAAPLRFGESFVGQIDDVMLFDAALTAAQLRKLVDAAGLTDLAIPPGGDPDFVPLYNGKDLAGWECSGRKEAFLVDAEGNLVASGEPLGKSEWLVTKQEYTDFVLACEFQFGRDLPHYVKSSVAVRPGLAVVVRNDREPINDPRLRTGAVVPAGKGGIEPKKLAELRTPGNWNRLRLEVRGPRLRVWVNDAEVNDVDLAALGHQEASGRIGLQSLMYTVRYRSLRIKELRPGSLSAGS